MAIITKNYDLSKIFMGPPNLYLDVAAPPSAVPPVQYTNTLQLDSSGQPSDSGTTGELAAVGVTAGGSGYVAGDILTLTQTGAAGGKVRVTAVSSGAVTGVAVYQYGWGYSVASGVATTGGSGSNCTINITDIRAGIHLGSIEPPATLKVSAKYDDIAIDQHAAPVDAAFVSLGAELDVTLRELDFTKFQRLLPARALATYSDLPAGTNPASDFLQVGSPATSAAQFRTVLVVGPRRDAAGKFHYVMLYRALQIGNIALDFTRGKATNLKLKWRGYNDLARVAGDRLLQATFMP